MSIRSQLEAKIALNTPIGGNATNRTRAVMHKLISHYYPNAQKIDESNLPVCEWDEAHEWVYLDKAHSVVIDSQVTPLHYGKVVGVTTASALREFGMKVIPINGAIKPAAITDEAKETMASRRRGRAPLGATALKNVAV